MRSWPPLYPSLRSCLWRLYGSNLSARIAVRARQDAGPMVRTNPMLSFGLAHPLDNISHALDDLSQVICEVVVVKKLPTCEHEVKMRCSDDPTLYRCRAACKGILSCCGRNCQASCHDCQDLNKPGPEEEVEGPILRKSHQQHPCQRRLYCEHQCDRMCSSDHECTTECKKECRQSCAHARCRRPCSEPCAPCQGPCAWYVQIFRFANQYSNSHPIGVALTTSVLFRAVR